MRKIAALLTCLLLGGTGIHAAAGEKGECTVYPAETVSISYGKRMLVRFDCSVVKNPRAITGARLILSGKLPSGSIEIRPVSSPWGAMCPEFRKRAAKPFWDEQHVKLPGWKASPLLFRFGDPKGGWASLGCKKWTKSGGDFGAVVTTLKAGGAERSADLTELAKSWTAGPGKNYGLVLAGDGIGYASARLVLAGKGIKLAEKPALKSLPSWLPKTYKVDHPRLPHPTKEWLAALKADSKRLATVCKIADGFNPKKGVARRIPSLVLAARLAPTPERLKLLSAAAKAPFPNHGKFAVCYGLAVLYDWGYDLLGSEDRRRLAGRLERMCTREEVASADTAITPYNDVGGSRFGCGLMWAALAIYPDNPAAVKHLWRAKAYYIDTTIPVWRQVMGEDGGYWHEIHVYYLERCLGELMAHLLPAWSSATGEDLFKKHPWLENHLYFGIYSTRPDFYRIKMGDVKCDVKFYAEAPIVMPSYPMLAQRYDNPYGRWWLQFNSHLGYDRRWVKFDGLTSTAAPWGKPFRKNAKVKSWDSLPPVRHSGGLGMVNMRSDWSEDATWIWFKCGPSFWSHSHLDSGTFSIYKRGALALDAGAYVTGYNSQHMIEYAKLSIAHNVVTVTNPDEAPYKAGKFVATNDGGLRRTGGVYGTSGVYSVPEWKRRADEFDTGKIVAFQPAKHFTYVCGDVTKAYTNKRSGTGHAPSRTKRVRKMIRSLLYLPPDHIVIFDQVESFNKDFKKRWLLHTVNEPKVEGNLVTVERADLAYKHYGWDKRLKYAIKADKKTHPFFKTHTDADIGGKSSQPSLYQYDGVMFVRTLLPEKPEIVKVGGDGKECWVDGKNRSKSQWAWSLKFRPHTGEGEAGRWRLEISPKAAAENDVFLNVIQVGLKSKKPRPTAARLVKSPDPEATGVEIELGGGRKATVIFKKGAGGSIKITGGAGPAVDEKLAEKVLPNLKIEK